MTDPAQFQDGIACFIGLALLILLVVACLDLECWFTTNDKDPY